MINDLIDIISKIKEKITDNSDMVWTHYKNAEQLRIELDRYIDDLKKGDLQSMEKLNYLFLPTASLQEHSISNGWAEEYLKLANEFDRIYKLIKNK